MDKTEELMATPRTDAVAPHLNLSHQDMRRAAWNLRDLARQLERELNCWTKTPRTEALPIAYVMQALSDGSIEDKIAPVGWAMFNEKMAELQANPWIKNGKAKMVPLYLSPPSPLERK